MTESRADSSSTQKVQQATRALSALRDSLTALSMPYVLQGTAAASDKATLIRDQLGDYILPRLASLDAPLLAVVGGSTGGGKSTLVSSLVRRQVARASAIRPTTRRPLLLHAPADAAWFDTDRVLGSLSRLRVDSDAPASPLTDHTPRELELRACEGLPEGLAIVDAPDVDSVVEDNRDLAATLLAGADLWIFVTTAARTPSRGSTYGPRRNDASRPPSFWTGCRPARRLRSRPTCGAGSYPQAWRRLRSSRFLRRLSTTTVSCPSPASRRCASGWARWLPTRLLARTSPTAA